MNDGLALFLGLAGGAITLFVIFTLIGYCVVRKRMRNATLSGKVLTSNIFQILIVSGKYPQVFALHTLTRLQVA